MLTIEDQVKILDMIHSPEKYLDLDTTALGNSMIKTLNNIRTAYAIPALDYRSSVFKENDMITE